MNQRVGQIIASLVVAGCFSSCATNPMPISPERMIRGIPATDATIVVSTHILGRIQDVKLDIGPSVCAAVASDETGVFFESNVKLLLRSLVFQKPIRVFGGVFVPDDPNLPCKPYYYREGFPIAVSTMDSQTTVVLVDARTNKETALKME